ncbi:4766_t:CDS:10, partial [Dentiscutata erythropus]
DLIPNSNNTEIEPRVYINALLSVHKMYVNMFTTSKDDVGSIISIDKVCAKIVNYNHVTRASSSKSAELLARFCDFLLRKSSKSPEGSDFEDAVEGVKTRMFFLKFYSLMLAKRLVNRKSQSDEAEQNLITKLKEECGFIYTSKLQQMFNDIGLSKDLDDQFKNYCSTRINEQGICCILLKPSKTSFTIPEELEEIFKDFNAFYKSKHSSCKLDWLFHLSKGELKANYCKNSNTGYTFQVSTYQMRILLQYNKNTSYTFEELMQKTELDYYVLTGNLKLLVEAKVLKLSNGSEVGDPLSCYELYMDFESKKVCIQLNLPVKSVQQIEAEKTNKIVEEDRKLLIKAAIHRIMKIRKTLKHVALVREVIALLSDRFRLKISDIKKCIDDLLEKEYIERVEGQKD